MVTPKILGDGLLGSGISNMYVVPSGTAAIVRTVILANIDSDVRIVNLSVSGTSSVHIVPVDAALASGTTSVFDQVLCLGPGNKIQGSADIADVVQYVVTGVEKI